MTSPVNANSSFSFTDPSLEPLGQTEWTLKFTTNDLRWNQIDSTKLFVKI